MTPRQGDMWAKYTEIHMPYPGIGHGGMSKERVEPLIIELPDMIHVWTYGG